MSLENHSGLIEQLKPLLMEPNFHDVFERLTDGESNSTRFLLKMELNRLSTPCTRIIDLRNRSDLHCIEFSYGKQLHFLDEPSIIVFKEAIALYSKNYTLGVYEQVIDAFKKRRARIQEGGDKPQQQDTTFIFPGTVLGSYISRAEERMNYSIKIAVSQPGISEQSGITVDLSVGGARIRIDNRHPFNIDKPINVKLLEIGEDYYYKDLQQGVNYQVMDSESNHEYTWLRLKRIEGSEELVEMLGKLIESYKFRYKVDINDVHVSATGLGLERHYLPHMPHLALFIQQENEIPVVSHQLMSKENTKILNYFLDEKDVSQLPGMLTTNRLQLILGQPEVADHSLFFCFTYSIQGATYFYSATLTELKRKKAVNLFLGFGASKASWRVFQITQKEIDHGANYKASILPGDNKKYSQQTEQELAKITHSLKLIDLTNIEQAALYQAWYDNGNANELKPFGQNKINDNPIKLIALQFNEKRREARYSFKTPVVISQGSSKYMSTTQDISSRGMQINLTKSTKLDMDEVVSLSFPKLQELSSKTKLERLPYEVVRHRRNGRTLHLAAIMGHTPHHGVEFLHRLIEHNKHKLNQLTENNQEAKEIADGLKNLVMRQLDTVPYFIEKTVKSARLSELGIALEHNSITDILAAGAEKTHQFNLEPLLRDGRLKKSIIDPIRAMKPHHYMTYFELFIQVSRQSRGQVQLKCLKPSDIGDVDAQIHFIKQSQNLGKFMAIRVYRGATGKPDINYIRRELNYIHIHAPHKAKQLEEKLWHIIGVGEFLDVTQEVMLRYPALHGSKTS